MSNPPGPLEGAQISVASAGYSGPYTGSYTLLNGAQATDEGQWVDVSKFGSGSVDVQGTFVGTIQIQGSNADAQPANSTAGNQIGTNITAAGIVAISIPVRWIKATVTAYTSGSISAYLQAVSP